VMNEMGKAMMGTGEATGEDRAVQAAEKAIANPLLDEISLKGAKGVLINITAGPDLTLFELDEAANRIRAEVDPEANIMVGSTLDPEMAGVMRVSVVATGIDASPRAEALPMPRRAADAIAQPAIHHSARPVVPPQVAATSPAAAAYARPEAARTPNFADHQVAETERASLFADPQPVVPQPSQLERTAPFGAPKFEGLDAPRAGEPSPEALRRLQAAVQNVPKAQPMVRPVAQPAREPERGGRLTINSLIHKMTGQVGREQAAPLRPKAPEPELEPRSAQTAETSYEESERERVDIPAFLRRQAN
jgi:cell division protein FtsZ